MGFSYPSGIRWANTAPIPKAEASQAKINGSSGLKCTNNCEDCNKFFDSSKAFSCTFVHFRVLSLANSR